MDIKGQGFRATVVAAEQSNDWLLAAAAEIRDAAADRGLELPAFAGGVAIDAANDSDQGDKVELVSPLTKESYVDGLVATYGGYYATVNGLNEGRHEGLRKDPAIEAITDDELAKEFKAWFTDKKLAAAQELNPGAKLTLIATPNVTVSKDMLVTTAKAFGNGQPYRTHVWDALYGSYSPLELSGTNPASGTRVIFRLVPEAYTPVMSGTVTQQQAKLAELQNELPEVIAPSPLDAVVYWNTLQAQGANPLTGTGTFARTRMRHFNLAKRHVGRYDYVPYSFVGDDGLPRLSSSRAQNDTDARVVIG